jgi:hypothetical protein
MADIRTARSLACWTSTSESLSRPIVPYASTASPRASPTRRSRAGEHRFDLGEPKDYTPDEQVETVNNTLPGDPRIIAFQLKP